MMTTTPHEGEPAPTFEVPSDSGQPFRLEDCRGNYAVLYFFPKADTPG